MALGPLGASYALAIFLGILVIIITAVIGQIRGKHHFPVNGRVCFQPVPGSRCWLLTAKQTILITGGSQGMGKAVARQLAQLGANVVIVARNIDKLKAAKDYVAVGHRYSSGSRPKQLLTVAPSRLRLRIPICNGFTTSVQT
jgi:hypothetical protein